MTFTFQLDLGQSPQILTSVWDSRSILMVDISPDGDQAVRVLQYTTGIW